VPAFDSASALVNALAAKLQQVGGQPMMEEIAQTALKNLLDRHGRYPADAAWKQLAASTVARKGADAPRLETGAHSRSSYHASASATEASAGTNDPIEAIQEHGAHLWTGGTIPPRPIIAPEARRAEAEYLPAIVKKYLLQALAT
jgi:hypothetical protein